MTNSKYYYQCLMSKYSSERSKLKEKKEKWEKYLAELNNFKPILSNTASNVNSCSSSLLGGGYLVGEGVSLDNGKLSEIASKLEDDSSKLSNVISKTQQKIEEFTQKITELTSLYEEAKRNYNEAKKKESLVNSYNF